MAVKLIYISNENTQNYHICRLQLVVETFGHSVKETFRGVAASYHFKNLIISYKKQ